MKENHIGRQSFSFRNCLISYAPIKEVFTLLQMTYQYQREENAEGRHLSEVERKGETETETERGRREREEKKEKKRKKCNVM